MKKKLQLLSFFIVLSFFSCKNTAKDPVMMNADFNTDFPKASNLDFKYVNKYDFLTSRINECIVDSSVLWLTTGMNTDDFGYCFDLNTGEKLSVIANKGNAGNEFLVMYKSIIVGDSIQLHSGLNEIKTFAKKDIIENKPMYERGYSSIAPNDSLFTNYQIKLRNGLVLATLSTQPITRNNFGGGTSPDYDIKVKEESIAIFNNNEVNFYETIQYDSFTFEENIPDNQKKTILKDDYSNSHIGVKGDEIAIFALRRSLILYTFDLSSKKVIKEKRYGNITIHEDRMKDDMSFFTRSIKYNDKYIYCIISAYFTEEDRKSDSHKTAVIVFDWDLNPIKRFDIQDKEGIKGFNYFISEDCSALYYYENQEDGVALYKSDLGL